MQSFHPPSRILMGPGPSDVPSRVLKAMAQPTIGHLDPAFVGMMDEIKTMLRQAFCTDNAMTFAVSAPGSAGMECCFANLVEPGDQVIVCINGVFGGRMKENVERMGGTAIVVEDSWGEPVSLDKIEAAFADNPQVKLLAFVHAETSTGVRSDAKALCAIARKNGALSSVTDAGNCTAFNCGRRYCSSTTNFSPKLLSPDFNFWCICACLAHELCKPPSCKMTKLSCKPYIAFTGAVW